MSMYNMVFGTHPHVPFALLLLGQERVKNLGRVRDMWFEKLPDNSLRIAVYTRNGGNNREEYMPDLSKDPLYIEDRDDSFDNTYATIYFKLPEDYEQQFKDAGAPDDFDIKEFAREPVDMSKQWHEAINSLGDD